ncbi:polysaccharide deacetylase family protein [Brevibacillus laterosporus]|uniref:polysaccharide deacetylase family protein n=1 Tax=Brevibacillus laterosporus TaxID=1465 RepID=UPI000B9A2BAA|nr:polysaccharide deacetylase family protein [Brevibacillus laterosporus]MBG9787679.1 xylanase [Brevibacillus laterosporus]MCG7315687.1 polysaccharide deacetylase family protein [Brevibacillus laterosporus]MED1789602.1 polysaccharide deacetylase family protein [Brevibacillus laterosporus]
MRKKPFFLVFFFLLLLFSTLVYWLRPESVGVENTDYVQQKTGDHTSHLLEHKELDLEQTSSRNSKPKEKLSNERWYKDKVVVLNYHHITRDSNKPFVMTPEQFGEHLQFIKEHNLQPISLSEFFTFMQTGVTAKENAVLLTFDDGYESYYTEAYPLLSKYGYPSAAFVIAGRLRDTLDRKRENMTVPLAYQQIDEMLASGLVDIGSHTFSLHEHKELDEWGVQKAGTEPVYLEEFQRAENEEEYRSRLFVDFKMSKVGLEQLVKKPIPSLSLPQGYTSNIVIDSVKEAGYQYVFTSRRDVVKPNENPYSIPRFDAGIRKVGAPQLLELFTKVKMEQ